MNYQKIASTVLFSVVLCGTPLVAQSDFFWSFQELNSGAVNENASGSFQVGESGSVFLYYSTNGPADSDIDVGAFLDIATSIGGVVEFTDAESFDFAVDPFHPLAMTRWSSGGGGAIFGHTGTISDDGQFLDEFVASIAGASGFGILESNNGSGPYFDTGYDAGADAFLFGRLDFIAIGAGQVEFLTEAGSGHIVNGNQIVPATFGGVSIEVRPIPEPFACTILALMACLPIRHKRAVSV